MFLHGSRSRDQRTPCQSPPPKTLGPSRVHAPSLRLGIGDPIPLPTADRILASPSTMSISVSFCHIRRASSSISKRDVGTQSVSTKCLSGNKKTRDSRTKVPAHCEVYSVKASNLADRNMNGSSALAQRADCRSPCLHPGAKRLPKLRTELGISQ